MGLNQIVKGALGVFVTLCLAVLEVALLPIIVLAVAMVMDVLFGTLRAIYEDEKIFDRDKNRQGIIRKIAMVSMIVPAGLADIMIMHLMGSDVPVITMATAVLLCGHELGSVIVNARVMKIPITKLMDAAITLFIKKGNGDE